MAKKEKMDTFWLRRNCENFINDSLTKISNNEVDDLQLQSLVSTTDASQLCSRIFTIFSVKGDDASLQENLLNLLSFAGIEFIGLLMHQKSLLTRISFAAVHSKAGIRTGDHPHHFSFTSEEEKKAQKKKKSKKTVIDPFSSSDNLIKEALAQQQQQSLSAPSNIDLESIRRQISGIDTKTPTTGYNSALVAAASGIQPPSFDQNPSFTANGMDINQGSSFARSLPQGTKKILGETYDEYVFRSKNAPPLDVNELQPISSLDGWAQQAFKGYKHFNRIQSKVFQSAYKTNENLLICAPTGAGKTNIALLAILHEIGQHLVSGYIKRDQFKIVFIAPMKALAAEMVENFSTRLKPLQISVREYTGDMTLTKKELSETQIIVSTPEKWDITTRKTVDQAFVNLVRLIIVDEVHLLGEDRGPVIESIIARTLRQVEREQSAIRIVGLSATLPNYVDVASFLRVHPHTGLFYFGPEFRPVPLVQNFIGIKAKSSSVQKKDMDNITFDKITCTIKSSNQIMIFVHSRKETQVCAEKYLEMSTENEPDLFFFASDKEACVREIKIDLHKVKSRELRLLLIQGIGFHHAGLPRSDRNVVEKLFQKGLIKALVCTATLAWGVNLPAHTVVIRGTQLYNSKVGSFVDLGMLDVLQMFGRAGRPQYDTSGQAIIITTHNKLEHYIMQLLNQRPIESQLINRLADNLNAEIVLGTVCNLEEAVTWLNYTYLFVRICKNPLLYGITNQQRQMDPHLVRFRLEIIEKAAQRLDDCRMTRFEKGTGMLFATDLGRVASHFYIEHETIQIFNKRLDEKTNLELEEIIAMVAEAHEFHNITVREEELVELEKLERKYCHVKVLGGAENPHGKVNILFQSYLSRGPIDTFALALDQAYVVQNASRIFRGLLEIFVKRSSPTMIERLIQLCIMAERRLWHYDHPLRQFETFNVIPSGILIKVEQMELSIDRIIDLSADEIGSLIRFERYGSHVKGAVRFIPFVEMGVVVQPISHSILRVSVNVYPNFVWNDRIHGFSEPFWIWVEDDSNDHIYHIESFAVEKKLLKEKDGQQMCFTIPIFHPLPSHYIVRAVSNRWLGSQSEFIINLGEIVLPSQYSPHTELLDLQPIPRVSLANAKYESIFGFSHFNPVQTQIYHTMFHTDNNALIGAPTGSGKTVAAELAILRLLEEYPENAKAVYIGPLKALVKERLKDWKNKFQKKLNCEVVELTGDVTPDIRALKSSRLVLTTPEKWDGITRNWEQRDYVKDVRLLIIDEIHMLGQDRGPILEVIVSRMRYISSKLNDSIRIVGLSTALANARDLADWLGIQPEVGLFNFKPSVRPVPLEAFITGFEGKHYCPRMATMNKPAYQAIQMHSRFKPAMVFVSSRRQTRLTAMDLIRSCANEADPNQFLHMEAAELQSILLNIRDTNLSQSLPFGIGIHHAGLTESDRVMVEDLFREEKIQILVCTSTLAWGVNMPAHLVVIKGTEFYDAKTKRYIDMPLTDVLQMMGRAGRPQYDKSGKAVIFVHEPKKMFYKKFLYEPFPVESNLAKSLWDHINAEIVNGSIKSMQDAIDYLTWTYFFRRLLVNPSYYHLESTKEESIDHFLTSLVKSTLKDLEAAECVRIISEKVPINPSATAIAPPSLSGGGKNKNKKGGAAQPNQTKKMMNKLSVEPMPLGIIVAYYYLSYRTAKLFSMAIKEDCSILQLIDTLCNAAEYDELPVRHNEDHMNEELNTKVRFAVKESVAEFDDPHVKARLLLQGHFSHLPMPISDYVTDKKSVLDQSIRILQAMIDIAAEAGWLKTTINIILLMQMIVQALWYDTLSLATLPEMTPAIIERLMTEFAIDSLAALISHENPKSVLHKLSSTGKSRLTLQQTQTIKSTMAIIPLMNVSTDRQKYVCLPGQSVVLSVRIKRESLYPSSGFVYAPHFPKQTTESWYLVVGQADRKSGELMALKRLNLTNAESPSSFSHKRISAADKRTSRTKISFDAPDVPGQYQFWLYLLSGSYLGIDQQLPVVVEVCLSLPEQREEHQKEDPDQEDDKEVAGMEMNVPTGSVTVPSRDHFFIDDYADLDRGDSEEDIDTDVESDDSDGL